MAPDDFSADGFVSARSISFCNERCFWAVFDAPDVDDLDFVLMECSTQACATGRSLKAGASVMGDLLSQAVGEPTRIRQCSRAWHNAETFVFSDALYSLL
jgi:hypothetical protein